MSSVTVRLPQLRVRSSPAVWAAATAAAVGACVVLTVRMGLTAPAGAACFFACAVVALAVVDLDRHLLPNRILLPAIAVLAVAECAINPSGGLRRMLWAGIAFTLLLIPALVYPAGLGMGDVKLAFFLGLGLGRSVVSALVLGLLGAALLGVVVLIRFGREGRSAPLPLGPFLALGTFATLLAGAGH